MTVGTGGWRRRYMGEVESGGRSQNLVSLLCSLLLLPLPVLLTDPPLPLSIHAAPLIKT